MYTIVITFALQHLQKENKSICILRKKTNPFARLDVSRGASRGSVWLSWQAPLYCRYSALKPIKYQTLSLQVSNTVVWNRQEHFPFNVAQYHYETTYLPCLDSACTMAWNNSRFWTLWIDIASNACFRISSFGSASSKARKPIRSSYTATHMQSCFVIFRFMARGHSVQLRSFCFAVSA